MLLLRYLSYDDIKFFQKKINSQIENPLILVLRWIISLSKLYEENQLISRKGAEVVFIVNIKKKTKKLIRSGLNFGLVKKLVVYFQEANFRTICYKYYDIGHDKPGIYKDRLLIYIIYERDYDTNNYKYNMIIYKI